MRLPVILVQNPPASGAALAESLVGNLIGRAGLDLTLVNRFDSIAEDSTDRMTLSAITVPSAVLDWQPAGELHSILMQIGFDGVRAPHQLDREPPSAGPAKSAGASNRRLFLFDLNRHDSADQIVAELDRLRKSLSVKTFSLGDKHDAPHVGAANSMPVPTSSSANAVPVSAALNRPMSPPISDPNKKRVEEVVLLQSDDHLDSLIDQLDDLDV